MIYVERLAKPKELSDEVQRELTEEFKKDNKKVVWGKAYIRKALMEMTHNKCIYCECLVGNGSTDMHVDHFRPKSLYPELVVDWDNLLPSCADCNRAKSDCDTEQEEIINPTVDNPKDHFYILNYRYEPLDASLDSKANRTIDILQLNDSKKKVMKRFEIGNALHDKLVDLVRQAGEHEADIGVNTRVRNRVRNGCRDLLSLGTKRSEYSAFMATILHMDSCYAELKRILVSNGLWDKEIDQLDKETLENAFVSEPNNQQRVS